MPKGDMTAAEFQARHRHQAPAQASRAASSRFTPAEHTFTALLDKRKAEGSILDWGFRTFTLRLDSTVYLPSFVVLEPDGLVFIELRQPRGPLEDDPEIRLKAAAHRWPEYDWVIMAKHGRGWIDVWWPIERDRDGTS